MTTTPATMSGPSHAVGPGGRTLLSVVDDCRSLLAAAGYDVAQLSLQNALLAGATSVTMVVHPSLRRLQPQPPQPALAPAGGPGVGAGAGGSAGYGGYGAPLLSVTAADEMDVVVEYDDPGVLLELPPTGHMSGGASAPPVAPVDDDELPVVVMAGDDVDDEDDGGGGGAGPAGCPCQ